MEPEGKKSGRTLYVQNVQSGFSFQSARLRHETGIGARKTRRKKNARRFNLLVVAWTARNASDAPVLRGAYVKTHKGNWRSFSNAAC
jgi:hypothetical protein